MEERGRIGWNRCCKFSSYFCKYKVIIRLSALRTVPSQMSVLYDINVFLLLFPWTSCQLWQQTAEHCFEVAVSYTPVLPQQLGTSTSQQPQQLLWQKKPRCLCRSHKTAAYMTWLSLGTAAGTAVDPSHKATDSPGCWGAAWDPSTSQRMQSWCPSVCLHPFSGLQRLFMDSQ